MLSLSLAAENVTRIFILSIINENLLLMCWCKKKKREATARTPAGPSSKVHSKKDPTSKKQSKDSHSQRNGNNKDGPVKDTSNRPVNGKFYRLVGETIIYSSFR